MSEEEKELLIDDAEGYSPSNGYGNQLSMAAFKIYFLAVHLFLFISLATNLAFYLSVESDYGSFSIFPELQKLDKVIDNHHATDHIAYSNFSGPPSQRNAAAWKDLLQPLYFNASEKEIQSAGASVEESVRVKEGGYIASLGVYHELHCLSRIRYFLYTPDEATNNDFIAHIDHCIEVLRLAAMCRTDLSVYTFTWPKENATGAESKFLDAHSISSRMCTDWSKLDAYIRPRNIGLTPTLIRLIHD